MKLVSLVAPVHNEEASIEEFVQRTFAAVDSLGGSRDFELILVDDGSTDQSLALMQGLIRQQPRLRVIELRRNYGQTAALQAGLDSARGEILVTLDADLQHFPEEIPAFLAKLDEGFDLVCGWRHERAEGVLRRFPSRVANWMIKRIAGVRIHDFGTTFRAYRAEFTREVRMLGEFHRFLPVLVADLGGTITEIPIRNIERPQGKSHYGLGRTFGVFLDIILLKFLIQYIDRPLRAFGKVAALAFGAGAAIVGWLVAYAAVCGIHAVAEHIGWFLIAILLFSSTVQILLTGILAEVLIRVLYSQGDRRVYRVRREWSRAREQP